MVIMEYLNIGYSEMLTASHTPISTNSSLSVANTITSHTDSNPMCTRPGQRIDGYINGLINCESCSKTFTTRGEYKYVSVFVLGLFFDLDVSILVAIVKPIPNHTVAIPAAKGLH